jgi:hypothetical protein
MPYKITSTYEKIKLKDILYNIISNGNRIITEESAKAILNDYGIRVPPFVLVGNKEASNKINTKATDYLVSEIHSKEKLLQTKIGRGRGGL